MALKLLKSILVAGTLATSNNVQTTDYPKLDENIYNTKYGVDNIISNSYIIKGLEEQINLSNDLSVYQKEELIKIIKDEKIFFELYKIIQNEKEKGISNEKIILIISFLLAQGIIGLLISNKISKKQKDKEYKDKNGNIIEIDKRPKDKLTGAYNIDSFDIFKNEKINSIRRGPPFIISSLDLDFFKQVNDKFGHDAGDFVLKKLVQTFNSNIRTDDIDKDCIYRIGGDEFIVIFQSDDVEGVIFTINKIKKIFIDEIEKYNKENKMDIKIGVSVGLKVLKFKAKSQFKKIDFSEKDLSKYREEKEETLKKSLKEIDEALYVSKFIHLIKDELTTDIKESKNATVYYKYDNHGVFLGAEYYNSDGLHTFISPENLVKLKEKRKKNK